MRKDTLYLTLSRDITSYTITSGQRAIATNVNYAVTIESPTLTTNLAGRDVSLIISDTEGNILTSATTFYPDTKNPSKAATGSLLLDGEVYGKFFDGKPVDTAVRLPIVIRDKSSTLLSSDIVVVNGGEVAEPSAGDEVVAGLVNAIRFYDLAEFKAWLDGTKERPDGLKPTEIVVGQWVHTQQDGSFICEELIGAYPSVTKNFKAIVTQFPLTGTLKMSPDNGVGLSVYSGDVYNDADATSFSVDAITYKGDAFTFTAGDNQIARQKDNYALENRVNSTMTATLNAVKADNANTYQAMLPVMNTTIEARDRAETAARGAKASETRAITAETNAATSEQNAEASKKLVAVSEANAGLYQQQALAYAQKAETEATTAATKATEASTSASEASASAGDALAHKNDAGGYAEASRLSAEASAGSAESSAASAAASKSSAETAAQSESIAVGSAAAAASSESTASQYKDTAVSAASLAVTSKDSASNFADAASASATAAAKSAAASASSASAAKQSETDLAEAVATANSLDGRVAYAEKLLMDYERSDWWSMEKASGNMWWAYFMWVGTMAQLGIGQGPANSQGILLSQINVWWWDWGDKLQDMRMHIFRFDTEAAAWKHWGMSNPLDTRYLTQKSKVYIYLNKDEDAPLLQREDLIHIRWRNSTSTAWDNSYRHFSCYGEKFTTVGQEDTSYGMMSSFPAADGAVENLRGGDFTREVYYSYVDSHGGRIDAQGAYLGGRIDAQGAYLGERIDAQGAYLGERIDALKTGVGALEAGRGAYLIQSRDVVPNGKPTSADVGKVIYFDGVDAETTSTLKVMNRVPFAQKVCPAPIASNEPSMCAVGCFDYVRNKKYIVFMTSISINPIGYLYQLNVDTYNSTLTFKSKLATSYFSDKSVGAAYWCRNICVHDGYVFYTRRHSHGGPNLTICEVETGKLVLNLDLDPNDTGGIYVNSAIWYNPLSGHICVLSYAHSLATGETWTGGHFIRVFKWNAEAKTLEDIPDGDSPVTVIDVTEVFTEVFGGHTNSTYGSTWPIRDQVFVSIRGASYMALFHATADDRIEPCYEWDVEYETGEDGITRPVWETQSEEWTDADGNVQTIQNYVLNNLYDHVIRPKMTKGRLLKFCCAAGYDGVPSGTWSANPVFHHPTLSFCESGENQMLPEPKWYYGGNNSLIALTDGVVKWAPLAGYKFVRREAFNSWYHLIVDNRSPQYKVSFFRRDEETGVYLLNDIRKGSARKFSGWLPKSGQYMSSVGATQTAQSFGNIAVLTPLTAAQSGTPLSRMGMVSNAGDDSAAMTPLPITATYSRDWWLSSMLPYCAWGFFGDVWMTTYEKTIGGVL